MLEFGTNFLQVLFYPMIYDHIRNQALYRPLHPRISRALDYINGFDPEMADGKVELDGENLLAIVQSYETRVPANKKMESHRRYVDLQYILSGEETLFHRQIESLVVKEPYEEERDVQFYHDADDQSLVLRAGDFCILFQHDGHKPGCVYCQARTIRKIVFKIRL